MSWFYTLLEKSRSWKITLQSRTAIHSSMSLTPPNYFHPGLSECLCAAQQRKQPENHHYHFRDPEHTHSPRMRENRAKNKNTIRDKTGRRRTQRRAEVLLGGEVVGSTAAISGLHRDLHHPAANVEMVRVSAQYGMSCYTGSSTDQSLNQLFDFLT